VRDDETGVICGVKPFSVFFEAIVPPVAINKIFFNVNHSCFLVW